MPPVTQNYVATGRLINKSIQEDVAGSGRILKHEKPQSGYPYSGPDNAIRVVQNTKQQVYYPLDLEVSVF